MPALLCFLIVLIVHPPSRPFLFPPAPIALIDSKTGGIKKPAAGVLGSDNSLTGAPEKHQGEAVEQEASNFVSGIGHIALASAVGKHPQGDPHQDDDHASSLESATPDPTNIAVVASDAQNKVAGDTPATSHDKTKKPMSDAMWSKTRPIMHALADIADGWERFGNALSPTPPFPQQLPRLKLAGLVTPILLVSLVTSSAIFVKMNFFIVGFVFFGDPILSRGVHWLNHKYPRWQKLLELRKLVTNSIIYLVRLILIDQ